MRALSEFPASILFMLLALSCASSGTAGADSSYSQSALIEHDAGPHMRNEMANDFLLYHAAKLALQQGFAYFYVYPRAEHTYSSDCCYGYGPSSYIAAVPVIGGADPIGSVAMVEVRGGFGSGDFGFKSRRVAVVRFVRTPVSESSQVLDARKLVVELEAKYERPEYRAAVARLRLR